MSIADKINDVKKKLEKMQKDKRYKKANKDRAIQSELTFELTKCAGDLGVCKNEFLYTITEQSRNVRLGRKEGFDTTIQEQQLLDSAVGYLLVKDALFALRTVSTYDSITSAYAMLDKATKKMTGERSLPFMSMGKKRPDRSEYGYLNSADEVDEKTKLVESVFEKLILTGDIEKCIADARANAGMSTGPNISIPDEGKWKAMREAADAIPDLEENEDVKELKRSAMFNTAPPKDD